MESPVGQSFQITPSTPSQLASAGSETDSSNEERISLDPTALDQDERFVQLPQDEQARLMQMSQQVSPEQLEDELQKTWEANFKDKGSIENYPRISTSIGESLLSRLLNK